MAEETGSHLLGIDIGGTRIRAAVVDERGKIISNETVPTEAERGVQAVLDSLLETAKLAVSQSGLATADIAAAGLAVAGLSDPESGLLYTSPNLPGWQDVHIRDIVRDGLGLKTYIINDANAAAVGELRFGAGRGARHFIYLTVSTGIGGGVIIDGQIYTGAGGTAGEAGHMTIEADGPQCSCGNRGCWETLASGTALGREAKRRIKEGATTAITAYSGGDVEKVSAKTVYQAYQAGDALAKELILRTARYLGIGLANLVNIFNPELIIIGGGLSHLGEDLLGPAREEAGRRAFPASFKAVRIVRAELGDSPGVLGAAAYARDRLQEETAG